MKNMLKLSQEQEKILLAHIEAQDTHIKAQDIRLEKLATQVQRQGKRSQKSDSKMKKMIRHIALVQNEDTSAPAVTDPVNHNQAHPMPVDGNFIAMPSGNLHGLHPHRDRPLPLPLPHVSHPYLDGPHPLPHGPPPDGLPTFQYGPPLPHGSSPHELPTLQYGPPRFLPPPPLPQGPKQSLPLRSKARLPIPIFSSSEEEEEEEEDEEDEEEEKEERHPPQIERNSNENPKKRKRKGGKNYICRTPPPSPPPELCNMRNDAMSVPNLVKQWYCNTDKYCSIKRREMIYRTGWRRDPNVQNIFFSRKGIINYIECVTNTLGEESKYSYRLPKNSVLISITLNQLSNLLEYYRMNRVGLSITRLARHCNANPEEVTKVLEEIIKS